MGTLSRAYSGVATGAVKFDTDDEDSAVCVEGGYAGTSFAIRAALRTQKNVYVAAGKTVHLNPIIGDR